MQLLTKKAKIFDIVRLVTGQEGTIVDISRNQDKIAFVIETDPLDADADLLYVAPDEIKEVLWSNPTA